MEERDGGGEWGGRDGGREREGTHNRVEMYFAENGHILCESHHGDLTMAGRVAKK